MKIMVAVDFSDAVPAVMAESIKLAQAMRAEVVLLHVAPPDPDFVGYEAGPQHVRDAVAHHLHEERRQLQAHETVLRLAGIPVQALLVQGAVPDKITEECKRLACDYIVLGSHGRGALRHLLMGSVAEGVLRRARCPVLVVPALT